jgi:GT2 family glycosyltransferase
VNKLSIVIVNYNVRHHLDQCLNSVEASKNHIEVSGKDWKVETWVVDNASVDGSQAMLRDKHPEIKLIANEDNLGFSRANNQAIRQSASEYVLLLNPDTIIQEDTLFKVIEFMDAHPEAGGLGVQMLDGSGKFLPESKRALPTPWVAFYKIFGLSALFPRSRKFGRYHLGYLHKDKTHEVDVLSGAFMFMRRTALEKAGLLDEDYFMYGEDIDLSYKIQQEGYKNYYFPETRIVHYKGESTKKSSVNYVLIFYKAMAIFARKHLSQTNATFFSILIHLAIYLRAALAIFKRLINRWSLFIWDALFLYGGMYYQKVYWENNHKYIDGGSYPMEYSLYYMPVYVLIWILAVWISGGYDRPIRLGRVWRGVGAGTITILVIYSLLPEELRTSRALILLGAIWAAISMPVSRWILHLLKVKGFEMDGRSRRIAILGNTDERLRVDALMRKFEDSGEIIGHISIDPKESGRDILGNVRHLEEIVQIFQIEELIIGGAGVSAEQEIQWMSSLEDRNIEIRIAPAEGGHVIGSQSIRGHLDGIEEDLVQLSTGSARRKKRLLEIVLNLTLLFCSPVLVFVTGPGLWRNIFSVLFGKANWVGLIETGKEQNCILSLRDIVRQESELSPQIVHQLNLRYIRHYSPWTDLRIVLTNLRKLGR